MLEPVLLDEKAREDLAEVVAGLARAQKELPPKFFYDERGSGLFEEITRLPEYYLTRAERALLELWMPRWLGERRPRSLVELGAGSARKTRIILDAMAAAGRAEAYLPVDISAEFLEAAAAEIRGEYPSLAVVPVVADLGGDLRLPDDVSRPLLIAFLGSTIGNFAPEPAVALLRRVRAAMGRDDRFLLGVDLRKDPAVVEAAYNDAAGVTAEFNLNMLRVLNARFGADFDPSGFSHLAKYRGDLHCVEMHLVSLRDQRVSFPDGRECSLEEGESIRTEISCKHDRGSVEGMLSAAGLALDAWAPDDGERYALALARAATSGG